MANDGPQANPDQIKAVANPLRLRILRLCNDRAWTNKELADRLERDPATTLHHVRLLVRAGMLEATPVRQGPSGAYEKPYRSTGLSWQLRFDGLVLDGEEPGVPAMLGAFNAELKEAGPESITDMTRFHLHLDEAMTLEFARRFVALVEEYMVDDDARRDSGIPGQGGILVVHRLPEAGPDHSDAAETASEQSGHAPSDQE